MGPRFLPPPSALLLFTSRTALQTTNYAVAASPGARGGLVLGLGQQRRTPCCGQLELIAGAAVADHIGLPTKSSDLHSQVSSDARGTCLKDLLIIVKANTVLGPCRMEIE